jgi:hypothetical protein
MYDSSCDGTWLLMKDAYEKRQWHSAEVNDYANSTICSYLNNSFLNLFDNNIQLLIKQVKIPYRMGSGNHKTISSGADGLAAKIFLLSAVELNWLPSSHSYIPDDGACLSYFSNCAAVDVKRIAYLDGSACEWWLRSPACSSSLGWRSALFVRTNGDWNASTCSSLSPCVRPAFILPSGAMVNPTPNADGSYTLLA